MIEIKVNDRSYLDEFIRLNEAWITQYFKLEAPDIELAQDPGKIISNGGFVFALIDDGAVAGACALFHHDTNVFQLARMAVDQQHQGKGFGDRLMRAAMGKLQELYAERVFLLSNTKLMAAIALYKKHGFSVVSEAQHPVYARCNIVMERIIGQDHGQGERRDC